MSENPQRRIPLVVLEEHHEAFYAWRYAQRRGWMPADSNTLLHVDAHADMWLPRLRRPVPWEGSLADLASFVYNELDIGSFIWPAAYLGTFNRILWLRHRHRRSAGGWRAIAISQKEPGSGEFCLSGDEEPAGNPFDPERKAVHYCPVTTAETVKTDQPIVLDIDLDYFCCNGYPDLPVREIEVTGETFREFQSNPYHFLRLMPGDKISAAARNGKYYLAYNDYRPASTPTPAAGRREAAEKLEDFLRYLRGNSIVPVLILVCRSAWSGYTPQALVDELEAEVVEALCGLYGSQTFSIAEILPASVLETYSLGPRMPHFAGCGVAYPPSGPAIGMERPL